MATRTEYGFSPVLNSEYIRPFDGLACAYVDGTVRDVPWIGSAYERLSGSDPDSRVWDGFVLRTCERVEVYGISGAAACRSAHPLSDVAVGVSEPLAVCRRLAEIAAGVSSRLLGERFIAGQVERASRALSVTHPLHGAVAAAMRLARRVCAERGFAACADYPDLIERVLGDPDRARSGSLIVVGSGVLGRTVTSHRLAHRYRRILVVTRSVKRMRKRFPEGRSDLQACSPSSVSDALDESGCDVVIATTNLVDPYRARVSELISDRRCRIAVDVSSVPLLAESLDDRYHNLYGSVFSSLIAEQNLVVTDTAERVRAAIASICLEHQR